MKRRASVAERMSTAVEANAADLLAYLERRIDPRSLAADVLGDAMETAWRKAGILPTDPTAARMWLFVVTRNTLLNHRRALGRHRGAVERLRDIIVADTVSPADEAERTDTRLEVREAIRSLPPADAELIRLVHWDGFSLAEVARLESLPATTVRSRYARALQQLADALGPQSASDPVMAAADDGGPPAC